MHIMIVIMNGKVIDVVCCADGNDRSHLLEKGKDYHLLDLDEIGKKDWIEPKLYKPEKEEEGK